MAPLKLNMIKEVEDTVFFTLKVSFSIVSFKPEMRRSFSERIRNSKQTIQRIKNIDIQFMFDQTHQTKLSSGPL